MLSPLDLLDRLVGRDAPSESVPVTTTTAVEPTGPIGPSAASIADALGLLDARSAPAPTTTMGRLGLPIQFAPDVPRSSGPLFTVSIPDEATRRVDAIKAREKQELAEVAARYRGLAASDPRFYHDRPIEARAIQGRYRFDLDAVDTQAAYAVAVAVEEAWAETVAWLHALYPDGAGE